MGDMYLVNGLQVLNQILFAINDAIHIWNQAPLTIKNCTTLYSVKKAIKAFDILLPI